MASIAEMLIGGVQKTVQDTSPIAQGAELAQSIQSMQIKRQEIEQKKQEVYISKIDKVMGAVEKGAGFKDKIAQNAYFKNYIPGMIKALKVDDFFNPELMGFMQSPEVRDKLSGLRLDIQDKIGNGELSGKAIIDYAKSKTTPEELAQLDTDSLLEQQKFAMAEEGKSYRAKQAADAALGRQTAANEAAPVVELNKKIMTDYAAFTAGGGSSGIESKIRKLNSVIADLKSGKIKTGTLGKVLPGTGGDRVQSIVDPKFKAAQDSVKSAINIKQVLDSQFSDKAMLETQRQLGLDGALPTELNIEKLEELKQTLETDYANKLEQFKSRKLKIPSAAKPQGKKSSNWEGVINKQKEIVLKFKGDKLREYVEKFAKKYDISIDEVKKKLGVK